MTGAIAMGFDGLSKKNCRLSCGGAFSLATIIPGDTCIDLGCGKGHDVMRMARVTGEKGHAFGIDLSRGMIETAKMNAEVMRAHNASFIQSTLEEITLEDDMADVVISNCTINHSLHQGQVWNEIFRILKPGGTFVVSDIYATEEVPEQYKTDPSAVAGCWAGAETKENYLAHIAKAGFVNISILEESAPYTKGCIRAASFTLQGKKPL
ncbi:MAG: methyltransferase domain-containing protein [Bacteroidales bacterium]|jgi:ubiquinone/menaquinone biosynthesis C-methylase UbiE|nr:methyltransferase domain-containing protein [Bacteroidales bacterium]NLM93167.1 methyltransferase domain-containing protein [Bacteroidales bacterium]